MEERTEELEVIRLTEKTREITKDVVVRESPLTIYLNEHELITLLCTPENLKELAAGFLYSEGILQSKEEIEKITADEEKGVVGIETKGDKEFARKLLFKRLITSGCGKGATFYNVMDSSICKNVESQLKISFGEVLDLMNKLQERSGLYRMTGGFTVWPCVIPETL